jgi:hypothetical protein
MVKKNTKKGSLIIILKENMLIEKLSCDIELFNLCFLVSPISLKAQSNNIKQLEEELRTIRLYNVESKMDKGHVNRWTLSSILDEEREWGRKKEKLDGRV